MPAKEHAMFRIEEIIVDANKLAEVLWLLSGKIRGMSAPQPMINVKRERNGAVGPRVSSGEFVDLFMTWVRERKLKEISAATAREFLVDHGRAASSTSYLFNHARKRGLIKNIGTSPADSRWQVLGGARLAASKKKSAKKTRKAKPKAKPAAESVKG